MGKIGFIGPRGAQVWDLKTKKTVTIPNSLKADNFSLSPRGTAIFFAPNGRLTAQSEKLANGFLSRPPYTRTSSIPKLQGVVPYSFHWSPSGNSLYLSGNNWHRVYNPATGNVRPLGFNPFSFDGLAGFDVKGRLIGYCTDTAVVVRDVESGKDRILFSTKKPKPIFDALRRANNPKKVADLLDGEQMLKEDPARSYSPWQLAGPVLSPDGTRAYFASNCATGFGAAGNGMQGYFVCDLKTGKISVLSKLGSNLGRPPEMTISPDGKRILAVSSIHSSAADNSSVALIIDLETQNSREIIFKIPGSKEMANLYGGSAWSPDGKHLALSAYFYDPEVAFKEVGEDGNWPKEAPSKWKTAIFEAATGKIWGIKNGMRAPSWSR